MRRFIALAPVAAFLAGCSTPAFGQVTYDPSNGKYTIMVYNDDDHLVPMLIESPGRVRLVVSGAVTTLPNARFRYRWTVRVAGDSPDPLGALSVPCPQSARVDTLSFITSRLPGRIRPGIRHQESNVQFCQFYMKETENDSVVVEMVSDFLPAFGEVRAQGDVPGVSWPTSDPNASNDLLVKVVDSLQGAEPSGVHVPVASVVPTRAPSVLSRPEVALTTLQADLGMACDKGWISPRGVCQSLEAKLNSARRSLASGNRNSGRAQIQAFRQELRNQVPTHITSEAASVLEVTAAWIEAHF